MSLGPCLPFSCFLRLYLLVPLWMFWFFFLPLSLLFDFSMQDVSLDNFKSQSLAFCLCSHLPLCTSFFLLLCRFSFFCSVLCLSCSPSLCVHAQQRLKEAPEQKVWVYANKNERKRECACEPHSPSLPVSAIRVSVAE